MIVSTLPAETESVARHYNELDEFYREVWGEHVHHGFWQTGRETPEQATEQLVHAVAERAGITPPGSVQGVVRRIRKSKAAQITTEVIRPARNGL